MVLSAANSGSNLFNVGGTLLNQGNLTTGPSTTIGKLVNQGSLTVDGRVTLTAQPGGITEIPSGTVWYVGGTIDAGSQNAFAHLTSIRGSLTLENGIATTSTPNGGTLGGSLVLGRGATVIVNGNYVGGGLIGNVFAANLDVTGTFTSVPGLTVLDGSLGASKFVNYGDAGFIRGGSQVGELALVDCRSGFVSIV